ncbi:isochorismatase domain-containing protein 1 [Tachyglossus aculeatus]|uniref:isochorismatase domain-containing protein 1 n=1 Tax=Tachyglossus aculeatus TaxID=9261 RepID=UPI0018F71E52|nr:isochorismatase domain-containing protein 1 [Tachyglossus aculeatus]
MAEAAGPSSGVPSSGVPAPGSPSVAVLFCRGEQARACAVGVGAGREALLQRGLRLFGERAPPRGRWALQLFAPDWGQFVDLPPDFVLAERCKLRLLPLRHTVPPLGLLEPSGTVFLCCDLQDRFRPAVKYFGDIISVSQRLLQGARLLGLPVVVTEQYPKGLGATVEELDLSGAAAATAGVRAVVPKTRFSMLVPAVEAVLDDLPGLRSAVLFGVETHVCVQQTALELVARGLEVHVVADATSSRSMMDRMFALERLARAGAVVTTSEAVLLQLVGDKEHPKFKDVQALIKAGAPESGLLSKV